MDIDIDEGDAVKDHEKPNKDVSELVSVAQFKEYSQWVYSEFPLMADTERDAVRQKLGISMKEFDQVEKNCCISQLVPQGGLDLVLKVKHQQFCDPSSPLNCIRNPKICMDYVTKCCLVDVGRSAVAPCPHGAPSLADCPKDLAPMAEVVLTVNVSDPYKKAVKEQEFLVLGSQRLTELRDQIFCVKDYFDEVDYSENPTDFDRKSFETDLNRGCKSAFIFINNTFYVDQRHPGSIDYSKSFIEWVNTEDRMETSSRLDNFTSVEMSAVTFSDLKLRLGYPYLYCHHGSCEHLLIFSDMRLLHAADSLVRSSYPKLVYCHKKKSRMCQVCAFFAPSWVTVADEMASRSPCYFCEDCFMKLHYSTDGKKLCQFKAYPLHCNLKQRWA